MAKKKKTFRDYTALGSISAELVLKNLPFVFFLGFIAMLYIANAHFSERKLWQEQRMKREVEELRWEYASIKADLMFQSKQAEVAKAVKDLGLRNPASTPQKILVPNSNRLLW